MTREEKRFSFEVKTVDDEHGLIEAYGSIFNNTDEGNDVVRPGAFTRTIKNSKSRATARHKEALIPMLWQHDDKQPIGYWSDLDEDGTGLKCKGRIILDTQRGQEAYSLFKHGVIDTFSIIYDVPTGGAKYDKSGVRELNEVRLFSVDPVTFAMNNSTYLVGVKNDGESTDENDLEEKGGWTQAARDEHQSSGGYFAGPDQSFPLKTCADVTSAWNLAGHAANPDKIRSNVKRWAKEHNCTGSLPDTAKEESGKSNENPTEEKTQVPETVKTEKKTFEDHFREEMCEDLLEDWQDVLLNALSQAVLDAVRIGDTPENDVKDALSAFGTAVLAWTAQGTQYKLSEYLQNNNSNFSDAKPESVAMMSSMSRDIFLMKEAMYAGDASTGGFVTSEHASKVSTLAQKCMKSMQTHVSELHDMANGIDQLLSSMPSQPDQQTSKAGRVFSASNAQAIGNHVEDLHDMADQHQKIMSRQLKSIQNAANDAATRIKGAEKEYETNSGTPLSEQQESKGRTPYTRTRTRTQESHSSEDTVSIEEIEAALAELRKTKA